jgi:hypothetical protein
VHLDRGILSDEAGESAIDPAEVGGGDLLLGGMLKETSPAVWPPAED